MNPKIGLVSRSTPNISDDHRVEEGRQADQPDHPAEPARVDRPGDCGRQRLPGRVAPVLRTPPGQPEDDERDGDRDRGATDRKPERNRQILPPTDPVQGKQERGHGTSRPGASSPVMGPPGLD